MTPIESTWRAGARVHTLVPGAAVIVVVLSLYVCRRQIETSNARIQRLERQATSYRDHIGQLENQVFNLERTVADLQFMTDQGRRSEQIQILGRHIFSLHNLDIGAVSIRYPKAASVLERILELRRQRVPWFPSGDTVDGGLDSAGFAAFILRDQNLLNKSRWNDESLFATISRVWKKPPAVQQPIPGDLVFYPDGSVLFYFEDRLRGPFVIGMTSFGILALDLQFAKVLGYRRVNDRSL